MLGLHIGLCRGRVLWSAEDWKRDNGLSGRCLALTATPSLASRPICDIIYEIQLNCSLDRSRQPMFLHIFFFKLWTQATFQRNYDHNWQKWADKPSQG